MEDEKLQQTARLWLEKNLISFVGPGEIYKRTEEYIEIRFWHPDAFNKNAVVDPPDICLRIATMGLIELIPKM
jgi:hypothetical protein